MKSTTHKIKSHFAKHHHKYLRSIGLGIIAKTLIMAFTFMYQQIFAYSTTPNGIYLEENKFYTGFTITLLSNETIDIYSGNYDESCGVRGYGNICGGCGYTCPSETCGLESIGYIIGGTHQLSGEYYYKYDDIDNISCDETDNIMFIVDTIAPTITGAINGQIYTNTIIITGIDKNFSGFFRNGTFVTTNPLTLSTDGTYTITGVDRVGNYSTPITFTIDKNITIDPLDGKYYTGSIFISNFTGDSFNYLELYTGSDSVTCQRGYGLGGCDNKYENMISQTPFNKGDSIVLTGEGNYIKYEAGGNIIGDYKGTNFTIDRTKPILSGITNGTYNKTGKLIIIDQNLSGIVINGIPTPPTFNTTTKNNEYIFSTDGNYTVTGYDKAGNYSTGINFTIDNTNPTLDGATNGETYTTSIAITATDENFSGFFRNGTFVTTNPLTLSTDGHYTITGVDKAGNLSTPLTFTIDQTDPTVDIDTPYGGEIFEVTNQNPYININIGWSAYDAIGINNFYYMLGDSTRNFGGGAIFDEGNTTETSKIFNQLYEALYKFEMTAYDNAGNANYDTTYFYVINTDQTKIIQSDSDDGIYANKKVLFALPEDAQIDVYEYLITGSNCERKLNSTNSCYPSNMPNTTNTMGHYGYNPYYERPAYSMLETDGYYRYYNGTQDMMFTIDMTYPELSGIIENKIYTGSQIVELIDLNKKTLIIDGISYTGNFTQTINGEGTHQITGEDKAGNTTYYIIKIDTTTPTISGITNGAYYTTGKYIEFIDQNRSGAYIDGTWRTQTNATITGEGPHTITGVDKINQKTTVTFIIDKTLPTLNGATNGEFHTGNITITLNDTNRSGMYINSVFTGITTTILTQDNTYTITGIDKAGNLSIPLTFTIDKTVPTLTGLSPLSGTTITGTNSITFSRATTETNLSGNTLTISGINNTYYTGITITGNTHTIQLLPNGSYQRKVETTDKANNASTTNRQPLTINTPLNATVSFLNTQTNGTGIYTKNPGLLSITTNTNASYTITGDITSNLQGQIGTTNNLTTGITLSSTDGPKNIYIFLDAGNATFSTGKTIYLDTTVPTNFTGSFPISGSNTSGTFNLSWTTSTDLGVGLSGYYYYISRDSGMSSIVKSGFVTTNLATINNMELGFTGTFYWYAKAVDKLGNISSYTNIQGPFVYTGIPSYTPTSFSFNKINNARTNRTYQSNTIQLTGLTQSVVSTASVDKGVLFISGSTLQIGKTGTVKNGDYIWIEMISSKDLDDSVSSRLTIGNFTTSFIITTRETEDGSTTISNLSDSKKVQVTILYNTLSSLYSNTTTQNSFMKTLSSMIQQKINDLEKQTQTTLVKEQIATLQYLGELVDGQSGIYSDSTTHVAPNGKVYKIVYDTSFKKYTSPIFKTTQYFNTIQETKNYIDIKNPAKPGTAIPTYNAPQYDIDKSWSAAPFTAPNGKVYKLYKTTDGKYGSYNFVYPKFFSTLTEIKNHINEKNPKKR